jgi:hypothetical protein
LAVSCRRSCRAHSALEVAQSRRFHEYKKKNHWGRSLIFKLANGRFIEWHEDVLLLGNAA